jgi:hypothetical protein
MVTVRWSTAVFAPYVFVRFSISIMVASSFCAEVV